MVSSDKLLQKNLNQVPTSGSIKDYSSAIYHERFTNPENLEQTI